VLAGTTPGPARRSRAGYEDRVAESDDLSRFAIGGAGAKRPPAAGELVEERVGEAQALDTPSGPPAVGTFAEYPGNVSREHDRLVGMRRVGPWFDGD